MTVKKVRYRFSLYLFFDLEYFSDDIQINESGYLAAPTPRRRSSSTSEQIKLEFEVADFFMFGSPLALVLAYRKISSQDDKSSMCQKYG